MFSQLYAVARNAFLESIRQPFYVVWLAVIGFGIALNPYLSAYTFDDDNKLAVDMGLSMLLVGSLLMAAFTASGVVSREIDNRTALTVISKPLPRPVFVIGKYLGVACALVLAWWNWSFLHLLSLRQGAFSTATTPWDLPVVVFGGLAVLAAALGAAGANYYLSRHFGALFARWLAVLLPIAFVVAAPFGHDFAPRNPLEGGGDVGLFVNFLAVAFILQAAMLFAAIAVACSTRLGAVATLSVMLVVFLVGLSSDSTIGRAAQREQGSAAADFAYDAAYAAVPNLQFHWLADALTQGSAGGITLQFVLMVTLYTIALVVGVLALAVALFQTRQTT